MRRPRAHTIVVEQSEFRRSMGEPSWRKPVSPFPLDICKNSPFPFGGRYAVFPWEMKKPFMNQWNVSIQKQFRKLNQLIAGN